MCHAIIWYHAICSHTTPCYNSRIACQSILRTGYSCSGLSIWEIPMTGRCRECKIHNSRKKRLFALMGDGRSSTTTSIHEGSPTSSPTKTDAPVLRCTNRAGGEELDLFNKITF
ncbi:hypothetical protein P170DRAFT_16822 [Aspergillus steynii IBT 23096]|uniref:Uncharacterized protein n=1 Tax=Aspergillus steynii IBT 23096 TaxID=1392250 RepID=A0A2I2GNE5_9EURO|nr:uncharacterized protein P170DRAFT_16822 [Aspergillus steynii IBT 23096]PLB54405.1 hypothetical protein P170DRAFT_16822 [Aspergillus steynii IBT 23096]